MDREGEGSASIHLLEVTRTAVKTVELMHSFDSNLIGSLVSENPLESGLRAVQSVDAFDDLTGVLLEEKDEELMLAGLKDIN